MSLGIFCCRQYLLQSTPTGLRGLKDVKDVMIFDFAGLMLSSITDRLSSVKFMQAPLIFLCNPKCIEYLRQYGIKTSRTHW